MRADPPPEAADPGRVAARLAAVREAIAAACIRSGRDPTSIVLVGASKQQPVAVLAAAVAAGLRVLGENRVQEALTKQPLLPASVDWHLIGPLQSNKAALAARAFSTVHAIDRAKIAHALDREAAVLGKTLDAFVEVNLGAEATKHGFAPVDLPASLAPLGEHSHLRWLGLMAIPPPADDPEASRPWFRALARLRDEVARAGVLPGFAGALSMGMSDDYAVAIEEGATHVRVGTALFGPRPPAGAP